MRVESPDGNFIVPGVRGRIVYRRIGDAVLALDAYVQRRGGVRPAVVVVHGGGWTAGSRIAFVGQFLETLTRGGFNWFSIDYRLGGLTGYADAVDDLRAVLDFIRCHAAEFQIDPDRIAVVGEDAGAHLAALLATERPARLRAAVLIGGFYDLAAMPSMTVAGPAKVLSRASPLAAVTRGMPDLLDAGPRSLLVRLFGLHALDDTARATLRRYSPAHHVSKDMPPLLLIHGTNERLWAQGVAMRDRLAAVGAAHELYAVHGAPHGMENWEGRPEWTGYKRKMVGWLAARLRRWPLTGSGLRRRASTRPDRPDYRGAALDRGIPQV